MEATQRINLEFSYLHRINVQSLHSWSEDFVVNLVDASSHLPGALAVAVPIQ